MKETKDYIKHIKESWEFAKKTAEEELKLQNQMGTNVALTIFDKCVSPYHYFKKDSEPQVDKPSMKQIAYAKKLGIKDPEFFTKKELSDKIDEVTKSG